jgi:hypothetical protein
VADARFERAVAAIDAANALDPNPIEVDGETRPKELVHAELVTEWVRQLRPDASPELLLAARAHHIGRWVIPRSSYPAGRAGYLRWRRALHDVHAERVAEILAAVGYDDPTISRVQDLVRKRGLGTDPEVQTLEDALCLVFVDLQLHELAERFDTDKAIDVVAKTLRKMSDEAIRLATTIDLLPGDRALIEQAHQVVVDSPGLGRREQRPADGDP